MLTKADLLAEMNRDIPAGVDWKAGARAYVASCFEKYGREPIERYSMNKPFSLMGEGADPRAMIAESVGYLRNLANALAFLQLRGGSRILDVGCGVDGFLIRSAKWVVSTPSRFRRPTVWQRLF